MDKLFLDRGRDHNNFIFAALSGFDHTADLDFPWEPILFSLIVTF